MITFPESSVSVLLLTLISPLTGRAVVLTADAKACLPQELYGYRVIHLSQVPPTKLIEEANLVPLLQTSGDSMSESLLRLLPIIMEVLPPSLLSQYAECCAELQKTLFTLCVFHAQVLCEGLHQAPLSSLVFVLSHLHKLHPTSMNIIIGSVKSLMAESYFTIQTIEEQSASVLKHLLTCLQNESGVLRVTDSLSIPLPSSDVSPLMYYQFLLSVATEFLEDGSLQRYSVFLDHFVIVNHARYLINSVVSFLSRSCSLSLSFCPHFCCSLIP